MKNHKDFRAAAASFLEEPGTGQDVVENLSFLLAAAYGAGVKDERKRQAKNRKRKGKGPDCRCA